MIGFLVLFFLLILLIIFGIWAVKENISEILIPIGILFVGASVLCYNKTISIEQYRPKIVNIYKGKNVLFVEADNRYKVFEDAASYLNANTNNIVIENELNIFGKNVGSTIKIRD